MLTLLHGQYMSLITAAAVATVVNVLWYSDFLFGPTWRKISKAPKMKNEDILQKTGLHFLMMLWAVSALYIVISVMNKTQMALLTKEGLAQLFSWILFDSPTDNTLWCSVKTTTFLWAGFNIPASICSVIWGKVNKQQYGIEILGQLAALLSAAVTLAYLT